MLNFTYNIEDAITPLDGRNRHKLISLIPYFSDIVLNKNRILIELKYLQKLSEYRVIRKLTKSEFNSINQLIELFDHREYQELRLIEKKFNHDVKAVEEYIKQKLSKTSLKDVASMVHFGLTSDDVNNIAWAQMIKGALKDLIIPHLESIAKIILQKSKEYKNIPMLSRTHGQSAAPTIVGKEFLVYYKRLVGEMHTFKYINIKAKLTGNVGNLNVHKFIYPRIDWLKFSEEFIRSLGLKPDLITTQIEPYDSLIMIFSLLSRINNILLGMCKDMWIYIMLGYFKQKKIDSEVGSTALPHKINPIYFEGAEGGFGLANALFEFYIRKLSYSRLQRDLSDSTVRRSFGIAFSYSLLSYQSVKEALKRIEPDLDIIKKDLNEHWEILSEAVQNFLRTRNYKNSYEQTKKFFRGKKLDEKEFKKFVKNLKLDKKDKDVLLNLSPKKYTGYGSEIVDKFEI